jgi:hypothetical protein
MCVYFFPTFELLLSHEISPTRARVLETEKIGVKKNFGQLVYSSFLFPLFPFSPFSSPLFYHSFTTPPLLHPPNLPNLLPQPCFSPPSAFLAQHLREAEAPQYSNKDYVGEEEVGKLIFSRE